MYTQLDGRFIEETLTPAQLVERSGESRDPERVHGKGLVIPRRRSTKKRRGETSTLRTAAPRRSAKVEATMQEVSVGGVDDERGVIVQELRHQTITPISVTLVTTLPLTNKRISHTPTKQSYRK
jgi:hypothetical protein